MYIERLGLVHTNISGLLQCGSQISILGDSRYFVTFIDDYSRNPWIYFMKQKLMFIMSSKFEKIYIENQIKNIKVIKFGNDEYELEEYLKFYTR